MVPLDAGVCEKLTAQVFGALGAVPESGPMMSSGDTVCTVPVTWDMTWSSMNRRRRVSADVEQHTVGRSRKQQPLSWLWKRCAATRFERGYQRLARLEPLCRSAEAQ